jgi:hypothetical protein
MRTGSSINSKDASHTSESSDSAQDKRAKSSKIRPPVDSNDLRYTHRRKCFLSYNYLLNKPNTYIRLLLTFTTYTATRVETIVQLRQVKFAYQTNTFILNSEEHQLNFCVL